MRIAAAVLCGFFMDLCLGDPDWMPHPVIYMGKAISALEKFLRRKFPDTQKGLLMAGAALAAILPLGSFLMAAAAIYLAGLVHPVLAFLLETLWCWQALAVKGLYTESMRVKKKLEEQAGQLSLHPKRRVLIAAGGGNNGADGIAIGRLLLQEGYDVSFYLTSSEEKAGELLKLQLHAAKAYGAVICDTIPDGEYDIIVDALFGIGLCRPAEGIYREAIEWINAQDAFVLAVDLPSGIETDTGAVLGCAVRADVTVTFGFWKRGLLFYPGCKYTGKVICTQIGITEDGFLDQTPEAFTFTAPVTELIPARPEDGNKGTFGKVLLLAGSEAMAGAAILCGRSAFYAGSGMVKLSCPTLIHPVIQTALPEAMTADSVEASASWADVIGAGPGLSLSDRARKELLFVLQQTLQPLVLDADAINLIAKDEALLQELIEHQQNPATRRKLILTPHPGELARLEGCAIEEILKQPVFYAKKWANRLQAAVLCKGARSIAASPDGSIYINRSGNSGMAVAGSGDVLTGIVTALLSTIDDPFWALCIGVYLHGLAGDLAAHTKGEYSMTSNDIAEAVWAVLVKQEKNYV